MNITYSEELIDLFSTPQHTHIPAEQYNFIGFAGDTNIGEYVHLYLQTEINPNSAVETKIIKVRFSTIGGVILIAAAEKFCSLIEDLNFQEALNSCDQFLSNPLFPVEKKHSVNFVIQAFYKAFESLVQYLYNNSQNLLNLQK